MARIKSVTLGFALALASLIPQEAFAMKASFSWAGIPACETISPAFTIADAPAGTKSLRFMLHDKDAPHFHHGGSTVAYSGGARAARRDHLHRPLPAQRPGASLCLDDRGARCRRPCAGEDDGGGEFPVK